MSKLLARRNSRARKVKHISEIPDTDQVVGEVKQLGEKAVYRVKQAVKKLGD
jgi:hypothetical protein